MTAGPGPHRRYNPLLSEWVLVSPQRLERPWLGRTEPSAFQPRPAYDPNCYLCPGNVRAGATRNPPYEATFVFDNDFPAMTPSASAGGPDVEPASSDGVLIWRAESGICRVVCFSPRHDLDLASLPLPDVRRVVDTWTDQYVALGTTPGIAHVQIFENRGEGMGASNPHPHGQIWANETLPDIPRRETSSFVQHLGERHACLLCDYLHGEQRHGVRIVCANETFTAMVPFWAVWPYEVLVIGRRHATGLDALTGEERTGLADILGRVTRAYDGLFDAACPYSMGIHQRPTDGGPHEEWHLHVHFYPPVLRSASVRKFMVGYELLAAPQRDLTAEMAAARLRAAAGEGAVE